MPFDVLNGEGLRTAVRALWDKMKELAPTKVSQLENDEKFISSVSDSFLTSGGFGNLRYYNGHLQCLSKETGMWVDTSITPDNPYIINMIPQPMKRFLWKYDKKEKRIFLKWEEPADTIIEGQPAYVVEKITIRRKLGSPVEGIEDGEEVITIDRHSFGDYSDAWYMDKGVVDPEIGSNYYYKAFPVSTLGFYDVSSANEVIAEVREYAVYGFKLIHDESDPEHKVVYIEDNEFFRPARMDFETGKFDYGDWTADSAFFMNIRPCMLRYDGTVDYYLNPEDYAMKENGEPSDIADINYEGNVMVEIPRVYIKVERDTVKRITTVRFSDTKLDEDYHAYTFHDSKGGVSDRMYIAAYFAANVSERWQSKSGTTAAKGYWNKNSGAEACITARTINIGEDVLWDAYNFSTHCFLTYLTTLITGTTNMADAIGRGNWMTTQTLTNGGTEKSGLFYGAVANTTTPVKIFGIENAWHAQGYIIAGALGRSNDYYNIYYKLTNGPEDGSGITGYENLLTTGGATSKLSYAIQPALNKQWLGDVAFNNNLSIELTKGGGSASTYMCTYVGDVSTSTGQLVYGGFPAAQIASLYAIGKPSYAQYQHLRLICVPLADTE